MPDLSRSTVPEDDESLSEGYDTSVAHPARVYNHLLGGKDNFAPDREASAQMIQAYPDIVVAVRANRAFLGRAVRYLSDEAGIRQFLDIGTGIPSANNTHEAAQAAAPESKVVYVDKDPMVLAHARALLRGTAAGSTAYLQADLQNVEDILDRAAGTLDFGQPVGVMLLAVLHYIPDSADPYDIVARLMAAVPAGSHLVISHAAADINADELAESIRRYNRRSPEQSSPRGRADVARFVAGLELVPPGLTPEPEWRASSADPAGSVALWGGVGRKNA